MDDWNTRITLGMVPIVIAGAGWVLSLESRIQVIDARQQERTARFEHLEKRVAVVEEQLNDPRPKPEARVEFEQIKGDIERLQNAIEKVNERINAWHTLLLQIPALRPPQPAPFRQDGRRGDLFELYPQRQP